MMWISTFMRIVRRKKKESLFKYNLKSNKTHVYKICDVLENDIFFYSTVRKQRVTICTIAVLPVGNNFETIFH